MNNKPTIDYEPLDAPDGQLSPVGYRKVGAAIIIGSFVLLLVAGVREAFSQGRVPASGDDFRAILGSALLWLVAILLSAVTLFVLGASLKKPDE